MQDSLSSLLVNQLKTAAHGCSCSQRYLATKRPASSGQKHGIATQTGYKSELYLYSSNCTVRPLTLMPFLASVENRMSQYYKLSVPEVVKRSKQRGTKVRSREEWGQTFQGRPQQRLRRLSFWRKTGPWPSPDPLLLRTSINKFFYQTLWIKTFNKFNLLSMNSTCFQQIQVLAFQHLKLWKVQFALASLVLYIVVHCTTGTSIVQCSRFLQKQWHEASLQEEQERWRYGVLQLFIVPLS